MLTRKIIHTLAGLVPDYGSNAPYIVQLVGLAGLSAPKFGFFPRMVESSAFWLPPGLITPSEMALGVTAVSMATLVLAKLAQRNDWSFFSDSPRPINKKLEIMLGGMPFTETDLFTNVIAFGGIGSGKTTCVVYPMLDRITALYNDEHSKSKTAKWGGYVLDVKGDFHETVIFVMEQHGRDVLEDLIVIRPDNDYFILEFVDIPTGHHFFVSCMGGTSRQEVDIVLETARGPEGLLSKDDTGLVGNILNITLPNGEVHPLSAYLFSERKDFLRPEIHHILNQLEFDVADRSIRWLGWREQGDKLTRVQNTKQRQTHFLKDTQGKQITVPKPTRLRIAGVHSISNGLTYNLISKNSEATEASGRIMAVAEVTGQTLGGDNAYFATASEKHIANCILLHRLVEGPNGRECSVNDVQKYTTNEKELKSSVKMLDGVIREKCRMGESVHQLILLNNLKDYFEGEWARLDIKTKSNIQSCVTNLFGDVTRNAQLLKTFCEPSRFNFRDCLNKGKVYALVLNAYPNAQKLIGTCMKLDFQQEVLKRTQAAQVNKRRFIVFLADEYQFFITTSGGTKSGGDEQFLSIARQSRILNLICTQSYSSLLAVQKDENKINAFLQCMGSRIFLQNLDEKTNKLAEQTFGQDWREKTSHNGADLKLSSLLDGKAGSTTRNLEKQNRYDAAIFPQLDGFEAVIFNKGRPGNKKGLRANLRKEAVFLDPAKVVASTNNYYQAYIENRADELGLGFLFNPEDSITIDKYQAEREARQNNILRSWREGKPLGLELNNPTAPALEEHAPNAMTIGPVVDEAGESQPDTDPSAAFGSEGATPETDPLAHGPDPNHRLFEEFERECVLVKDAKTVLEGYTNWTNKDNMMSDLEAGKNTEELFEASQAEVQLPEARETPVEMTPSENTHAPEDTGLNELLNLPPAPEPQATVIPKGTPPRSNVQETMFSEINLIPEDVKDEEKS